MKNIEIEFVINENHLKVNDIVLFPDNQRVLIVDNNKNGIYYEITAYPFPISKYWIVAMIRFAWIKVRYSLIKLWRKTGL
jgi:hypothetical protein